MFDITEEDKEELKERLRAQVGIGTLIVFIAMVLVAAIAAGVLINTAGFLQSKSEATGQQSGEQVTNRLQVLQASGTKTVADSGGNAEKIGAVILIGTKAPGADDIALNGITMQWVDDSGTYDLVHENAAQESQVDGYFTHTPIKDADDSLGTDAESPVINSGDDRARIVIDIGNAETSGDIADAYQEGYNDNGDRIRQEGLKEGATASIRITTQSGTASTVQLVVPESLSGTTAVRL